MDDFVLIPEHKIEKNYNKKIFLNETSKLINLKFFDKSDIVIKYLDLDRKNRIKEFKYIEKISLIILKILKNSLNNIHRENNSLRYWKIILGPWLHLFICSLRNRYRKINFILNKKKNINFFGFFEEDEKLVPQDTKDFEKLHCSNEWNSYIYFKIFEFLKPKNILAKKHKFKFKNLSKNTKTKYSKRFYFDSVFKILDFKKNKIFIHNSGMGIINEIFLNLLFFQIPRFYNETDLKKFGFDKTKRKTLKSKILQSYKISNDKFLNFLIDIISMQLPIFILEGYKFNVSACQKQNYPSKPKAIFTSNSFETNEMFKIYTAMKLDKEARPKYFVGQHGNCYNTHSSNLFANEISTSDYFINWGVKKDNQIKFCNFISKKIKYKKNIKKYLLIVLRSKGLKYTLWDRELHNSQYEVFLKKFLNGLDLSKIQADNILIKPHFSHNYNDFFIKNITKKYPDIKILDPRFKISSIFHKCKLVVFNYDGTSYLDLLSSNFPTLAFWPGDDRHVVDDMRRTYSILKKNSFWSSNPFEISSIINENWNKIEEWWFNKKKQKAIKYIQKNLCQPKKKFFLFELKKIINSKIYN